MMQRLNSRVLSLARLGQSNWMLDVPDGASIWERVSAAFAQHDIQSAHLDLMGGHLRSAIFYTGYPDPAGKRIAQYGAPNHTGNATLISAMGIYGKDREGKPLLHCHGCLVTGNGQTQGGHLDTQQCIVGQTGIRIYVTATNEIEFVARLDATSGMYVFHPQLAEHIDDTAQRAAVSAAHER
ncbi:putative DNA-binding protein with PD1-like motif [Advenella incenata]|jgi:predicted DNA-binding protein with PD1-like motif|uniref:Putative DNA-binding protein with PD1-like motif n=1 Tax=Advenella incenata TaxID=267800 RepID=A0A4Q7VV00_9BURK|nr:DUF296 domain-containing protein [Advenella incenata]RZU00477.1 putative DNA-binding protein with PD1-like motif [Advenella incenata]